MATPQAAAAPAAEEGDQPAEAIEVLDEEGDGDLEEREEEEAERAEESWKDDDFLSFDRAGGGDGDDVNNDEADDGAADEGARRGLALGRSHHQMNEQRGGLGVADLPPWMDDYHRTGDGRGRLTPPLVLLHNEMVQFAALMAPRKDEIREREEIIGRVRGLVEDTFGKNRCKVQVFGSQATGLFLPTSDIDLVIHLDKEEEDEEKKGESAKAREQREMDEWDMDAASKASPLRRLGDALRRRWIDDLTYLEVVENTRVPIVKFTLKAHSPSGTASGTDGISVDICFDQTGGTQSAELVERFMEAMPPLRPLTFVLKYFMEARGLNEPYTGGVGSFLLQMMIVSFLQHREREEYNARRDSVLCLGSLLLDFFELYGVDFNYITTGISVRNDGRYFAKGAKDRREDFWVPSRPFSLALENPFETSADVGRPSYRMQLVQKSFEVAFRTVLAHVSEPPVPAVSILASILPPTEEMRRRATLRKVDAIEQGLRASGYQMQALQTGRDSKKRWDRRDSGGSDMDLSEGEEDYKQKRRRR